MQALRKKILIYIKNNPESSEEITEQLGKEVIQTILDSQYSDHYKKKLVSLIRKEIKSIAGNHAILNSLRLPKEFLVKIKEDHQEKTWANLKNKELISLREYEKLCEALLSHEKSELLFLGLLLATGRRYSELKINNFEMDEASSGNLIFKGQLKKREEQVSSYSIPLLAPRPLVLKAFIKLNQKEVDLSEDKFYQSVNRHSHWLFKHKIHALRAKYCSLIMAREGVLESHSRIEPLARAKDLLGHTTQSDATFSYRQYAVQKKKMDSKKLEKMIKNLSLYEREGEKHIRIGFLKIKDELEKIIPLEWLGDEWLAFLPKAKKLYKETFGRTANYNGIKRFWEKKRQE